MGTGASYVSGTVTFTESTISWNPTTDKLTFTLGTLGTGTVKSARTSTAGLPRVHGQRIGDGHFGQRDLDGILHLDDEDGLLTGQCASTRVL